MISFAAETIASPFFLSRRFSCILALAAASLTSARASMKPVWNLNPDIGKFSIPRTVVAP